MMKPFRIPSTPDIEQTEACIYCDVEKLLDEGENERVAHIIAQSSDAFIDRCVTNAGQVRLTTDQNGKASN